MLESNTQCTTVKTSQELTWQDGSASSVGTWGAVKATTSQAQGLLLRQRGVGCWT